MSSFPRQMGWLKRTNCIIINIFKKPNSADFISSQETSPAIRKSDMLAQRVGQALWRQMYEVAGMLQFPWNTFSKGDLSWTVFGLMLLFTTSFWFWYEFEYNICVVLGDTSDFYTSLKQWLNTINNGIFVSRVQSTLKCALIFHSNCTSCMLLSFRPAILESRAQVLLWLIILTIFNISVISQRHWKELHSCSHVT